MQLRVRDSPAHPSAATPMCTQYGSPTRGTPWKPTHDHARSSTPVKKGNTQVCELREGALSFHCAAASDELRARPRATVRCRFTPLGLASRASGHLMSTMISRARWSNYLGWLLRRPSVQRYLLKQIDRQAPGPSEEKREKGKSFLWGKVRNARGDERVSRLVTLSGYALTAQTAVLIAEKIIAGNRKTGYQTPSTAYGADLILEIPGTTRTDS